MKKILYIQYTNPGGYPPLEHSSRILADAGWKVLFLGTGADGANDLALPAHRNIVVRQMNFCKGGWWQKVHFMRFCVCVLWNILILRPDWVYASDPLSCPVAALISFLPGVSVLYHEHDSPDSKHSVGWFQGLVLRARRWIARRAKVCVLPNAERLARFRNECGPLQGAECVWNCPAKNEVAAVRDSTSIPVWVLYHGSIVPDRLPKTVLDALALLPASVRLRVVGYETAGSRGYVAELRQRAQELSIGARIEFLNPVPQRADLLAITRRSDIGLALMPLISADFNCETMTGASNKAFDYLACGLPIIVSSRPDWHAMFVEPGFAVECDPCEAHSIANAIGSLLEEQGCIRAMGEAGRRRIIEAWNYESVFEPVMQRLANTCSSEALQTPNQRLQNVR